ncbi:hypothetical protein HDU67_009385, partial [Dinochytrium kinnereticum]
MDEELEAQVEDLDLDRDLDEMSSGGDDKDSDVSTLNIVRLDVTGVAAREEQDKSPKSPNAVFELAAEVKALRSSSQEDEDEEESLVAARVESLNGFSQLQDKASDGLRTNDDAGSESLESALKVAGREDSTSQTKERPNTNEQVFEDVKPLDKTSGVHEIGEAAELNASVMGRDLEENEPNNESRRTSSESGLYVDAMDIQTQDEDKSTDATLLRRLVMNPNKSVEGGVSISEVQRVTYELSKGSKFFAKEQERDEKLQLEIAELLKRRDALTPADIERGKNLVEEKLKEAEEKRDLSRCIVHVDMDAFYASVEELERPELKEKPMAVGGGEKSGVLCTANYAARQQGVRSAMPVFVARKLCPELILVPPDFEKYTAFSDRIKNVLKQYDPNLYPASLDEAYMDITSYVNTSGLTPDAVVEKMRAEIFEQTGLTASAGIAANKMLAKVGSNQKKPNGQFRVPNDRDAIMDFLKDLSIRKISGIGRVSEQILNAFGVKTCGDVLDEMLAKLKEISNELAEDLERSDMHGKTVTLKVKKSDHTVLSRSRTLAVDICSSDDLFAYGEELLRKLKADIPSLETRLLGLSVSKLSLRSQTQQPDIKQMFIKQESKPKEQRKKMNKDIDEEIEEMEIETNCPICHKKLVGKPLIDFTPHIEMCLLKQSRGGKPEKTKTKRKHEALADDPVKHEASPKRNRRDPEPNSKSEPFRIKTSPEQRRGTPLKSMNHDKEMFTDTFDGSLACPICYELKDVDSLGLLNHIRHCLHGWRSGYIAATRSKKGKQALEHPLALTAIIDIDEDPFSCCPICGSNSVLDGEGDDHIDECLSGWVKSLPEFSAGGAAKKALEATFQGILRDGYVGSPELSAGTPRPPISQISSGVDTAVVEVKRAKKNDFVVFEVDDEVTVKKELPVKVENGNRKNENYRLASKRPKPLDDALGEDVFPMTVKCPLCQFSLKVNSEREIERHVEGCLIRKENEKRKIHLQRNKPGSNSKDSHKKMPATKSKSQDHARQLPLAFSQPLLVKTAPASTRTSEPVNAIVAKPVAKESDIRTTKENDDMTVEVEISPIPLTKTRTAQVNADAKLVKRDSRKEGLREVEGERDSRKEGLRKVEREERDPVDASLKLTGAVRIIAEDTTGQKVTAQESSDKSSPVLDGLETNIEQPASEDRIEPTPAASRDATGLKEVEIPDVIGDKHPSQPMSAIKAPLPDATSTVDPKTLGHIAPPSPQKASDIPSNPNPTLRSHLSVPPLPDEVSVNPFDARVTVCPVCDEDLGAIATVGGADLDVFLEEHVAECVGRFERQDGLDLKDARDRSTAAAKAATKCRLALLNASTAVADFADALELMLAARTLDRARWDGAAVPDDGLWPCISAQTTLARGLRDLSDLIQRDFEDPLQAILDNHSQMLQTTDKTLYRQTRDLHDRIRRAETKVKQLHRSRDPDQAQSALHYLAVQTSELDRLRRQHDLVVVDGERNRILGIRDACFRVVEGVRGFAGAIGRGAERALKGYEGGGEGEDEGGIEEEEVDVDTAIATGNFAPALRLSLGGPLLGITDRSDSRIPFYLTNPPPSSSRQKRQQQDSSTQRRRGSLDSLTDGRFADSGGEEGGKGGKRLWGMVRGGGGGGAFGLFGRSGSGGVLPAASASSSSSSLFGLKGGDGAASTLPRSGGGGRDEGTAAAFSPFSLKAGRDEAAPKPKPIDNALPADTVSAPAVGLPPPPSTTFLDATAATPGQWFSLDRGLTAANANANADSSLGFVTALRGAPPVISARSSSLSEGGEGGGSRGGRERRGSEGGGRTGRMVGVSEDDDLALARLWMGREGGGEILLDEPALPSKPQPPPPPPPSTKNPGRSSMARATTPSPLPPTPSKPTSTPTSTSSPAPATPSKPNPLTASAPTAALAPTVKPALLTTTSATTLAPAPVSKVLKIWSALGRGTKSGGSAGEGVAEEKPLPDPFALGRVGASEGERGVKGEGRDEELLLGVGVGEGGKGRVGGDAVDNNTRGDGGGGGGEFLKSAASSAEESRGGVIRGGGDLPNSSAPPPITSRAGTSAPPSLTARQGGDNPRSAIARKRGSKIAKKKVTFTASDRPMVEFASFPSDGAPKRLRRAVLSENGELVVEVGPDDGEEDEDEEFDEEEWEEEWDEEDEEWEEEVGNLEEEIRRGFVNERQRLGEDDDDEFQDSEVGLRDPSNPFPNTAVTTSTPTATLLASTTQPTTLQTLYPTFFCVTSHHLSNVPVPSWDAPTSTSVTRATSAASAVKTVPTVYFPPQADVQSEVGSVVDPNR